MNLSFTSFKEWLTAFRPASAPTIASSVSVAVRLNLADELASAGRPTEAASIYADILRSHPDDIGTYINAGSLCITHRDYTAAIGILWAGLDRAPSNTHLWANLSAALSATGEREAALDAANRAIQHGPNNAMAYYNRAECWAAVDQMFLSIRDLETANGIDPHNDEIARKLRLSRLAIAPPLQQYEDAKYEPKAHGYEFVDGIEVRATLQCPHCGNHFKSVKGSGVTRGWCSAHWAITCGRAECRTCIDFREKLGLEQSHELMTG